MLGKLCRYCTEFSSAPRLNKRVKLFCHSRAESIFFRHNVVFNLGFEAYLTSNYYA